MKKIIFLIIILVIAYFVYNFVKDKFKETPPKFIYEDLLNEIGENKVNVTYFAIYGKYLNLKGDLPSEEGNYELVLKNNETEKVLKTFNDSFNTSDYINDGINIFKAKEFRLNFSLKLLSLPTYKCSPDKLYINIILTNK